MKQWSLKFLANLINSFFLIFLILTQSLFSTAYLEFPDKKEKFDFIQTYTTAFAGHNAWYLGTSYNDKGYGLSKLMLDRSETGTYRLRAVPMLFDAKSNPTKVRYLGTDAAKIPIQVAGGQVFSADQENKADPAVKIGYLKFGAVPSLTLRPDGMPVFSIQPSEDGKIDSKINFVCDHVYTMTDTVNGTGLLCNPDSLMAYKTDMAGLEHADQMTPNCYQAPAAIAASSDFIFTATLPYLKGHGETLVSKVLQLRGTGTGGVSMLSYGKIFEDSAIPFTCKAIDSSMGSTVTQQLIFNLSSTSTLTWHQMVMKYCGPLCLTTTAHNVTYAIDRHKYANEAGLFPGNAGSYFKYQSNATVNQPFGVDCFWDEKLQKLYVGLAEVGIPRAEANREISVLARDADGEVIADSKSYVLAKADPVTNAGANLIEPISTEAVTALLIGYPESSSGPLNLHSIVGTSDRAFPLYTDVLTSGTNYFESIPINKRDLGRDAAMKAGNGFLRKYRRPSHNIFCNMGSGYASVRKVRTMHTSTGKSYLIMNGIAEDDGIKTQAAGKLAVFAIPLVDGPAASPADVGYVASRDDHSKRALHGTEAPSCWNEKMYQFAKTDFATGFDNVMTSTDRAVAVGQSPAYLYHTDADVKYEDYLKRGRELSGIQQMQVVGDTVYVSVAGYNQDASNLNTVGEEAGVFSSTAIFDKDGFIRAWTPWQRAVPYRGPIEHFAVDEEAQSFLYIPKYKSNVRSIRATPNQQIVAATTWSESTQGKNRYQWRAGDKGNIIGGSTSLSSVLDKNFTTTFGGGVLGLYAFDAATQGLVDKPGMYPVFSMLVATGNGRVALIAPQEISGSFDGEKSEILTTQYKCIKDDKADAGLVGAKGSNVFIFDETSNSGKALKRLGPITCAEWERSGQKGSGRLWVGGQNGIAVLRDPTSGKGFGTTGAGSDGVTSLDQFKVEAEDGKDLPGKQKDVKGETFYQFAHLGYKKGSDVKDVDKIEKQLPIKDVRKLVSDGRYLYILTKDRLLRLEYSADDYKEAQAIDYSKNIVTPYKDCLKMADDSKLLVLATVDGYEAPLSEKVEANPSLNREEFYKPILDQGDEFYDMVVVKGGSGVIDGDKYSDGDKKSGKNPARQIVLATSRGLFVSPLHLNAEGKKGEERYKLPDLSNLWFSKGWTRPYEGNTPAFECGPAMKLEMKESRLGGLKPGWVYDGNLYATAFDKNQENICVYRFDVHAFPGATDFNCTATISRIREPYLDADGKPVDYFYKVGKVKKSAYQEVAGNLEYRAQPQHYGNYGVSGDTIDRVTIGPNSKSFLKAFQPGSAIDLGLELDSTWHPAPIVKDPISGTLYVAGEFGMRENR